MKQVYAVIILLIFSSTLLAQAPQAINYQGVARNSNGIAYASQDIALRLSIRNGTPDGSIEYSETRNITTNQFGLFNVQIGSPGASGIQGSFSSINWAVGLKFLQTEISVNNGSFVNLGTTQMMSVPFALHSNQSKDLVLPFSKTQENSGSLLQLTNNHVNGTAIIAQNNSGGTALEVNGNLRIFGGSTTPGAGKVLTSDASGNATWKAISQSSGSGFSLPYDTIVDLGAANIFKIRNNAANGFVTIMGESLNGVGVFGISDNSSGVRGNTNAKNQAAIDGIAFADSATGVMGKIGSSFINGVGVLGVGGLNNNGVRGTSGNKAGVQGFSDKNYGVYGESKDFIGIYGNSKSMSGIVGSSINEVGIMGYSENGDGGILGVAGQFQRQSQYGVKGESFNTSTGVLAKSNGSDAIALAVEGRMKISGGVQNPAEGKVLTSDASGNATWQFPSTIAFRASGLLNNQNFSIPDATGRKVMFFQEPRYNIGNAYDGNNSIFFVPVAGIYSFNTQVDWEIGSPYALISIKLLRNGVISSIAESESGSSDFSVDDSPSLSTEIALQPNDAIWVEIYQANVNNTPRNLVNLGYKCWFAGRLITRL